MDDIRIETTNTELLKILCILVWIDMNYRDGQDNEFNTIYRGTMDKLYDILFPVLDDIGDRVVTLMSGGSSEGDDFTIS